MVLKHLFLVLQEYESQQTPEAKFVKELDVIDMLLQAFEYEKEQNVDLNEFFINNNYNFVFPLTKSIHGELIRQRRDIINSRSRTNGSINTSGAS